MPPTRYGSSVQNTLRASLMPHWMSLGETCPGAMTTRQSLVGGLGEAAEDALDELDTEFFGYPDDLSLLLHNSPWPTPPF